MRIASYGTKLRDAKCRGMKWIHSKTRIPPKKTSERLNLVIIFQVRPVHLRQVLLCKVADEDVVF